MEAVPQQPQLQAVAEVQQQPEQAEVQQQPGRVVVQRPQRRPAAVAGLRLGHGHHLAAEVALHQVAEVARPSVDEEHLETS